MKFAKTINNYFRRSIQSAFDGGGSGHSLKMSSSLIGKYGGHPSQYSDISHMESHNPSDFRSNSSPQGLASEKTATLTSPNNDDTVEDNCFASKDNNDAMNESTNDLSNIAKLVPNNEEIRVGSKSLFDQMEDAVAKAKFIAAQQFLLQNFHKQRQALMNAASLQNTTMPLEEKKRSLSQFPFTPFPFNIPQPSTMIGHPPFPSFSPFHNVKTESSEGDMTPGRKEKDNPGDPVETRMNGADPNPRENALLLFSQIQNYRRHLLDSGIAKFPSIASLDQNSLRQCDQLITPF